MSCKSVRRCASFFILWQLALICCAVYFAEGKEGGVSPEGVGSTEDVPSFSYSAKPVAEKLSGSSSSDTESTVASPSSSSSSFPSSSSPSPSALNNEAENGGCLSTSDRDIITGKAFKKEHMFGKNNDGGDDDEINTDEILRREASKFLLRSFPSFERESFSPKPSNEFFKILFKCGKKSMGNVEMVEKCLAYELKEYKLVLSDECSACYAETAHCGAKYCTGHCLTNECSSSCIECGKEKCESALKTCTKLEDLPQPCEAEEHPDESGDQIFEEF